jgi:hypothetical protein
MMQAYWLPEVHYQLGTKLQATLNSSQVKNLIGFNATLVSTESQTKV